MTKDEIMALEGSALNQAVAEIVGINLKAVTDKEIGKAVFGGCFQGTLPAGNVSNMVFRWNEADYKIPIDGSRFNYGGADGNAGYGLWLWHNRRGKAWEKDIEKHVEEWRKPVKPYSTDIAAAWEVVKKFDNMLFRRGKEADGHIRHFAYIWLSETDERHVMCKAETMPLAICRAALLATMGVEADV